MSHLNYFEPFKSKKAHHEDQLTRAYLIVLRYSPAALLAFYDMARESCLELARKKGLTVELPNATRLNYSSIGFDTQTSSIQGENINKVLSVLLTDRKFVPKTGVKASDRKAVYDGVLVFGEELAILIENKPHQENVWEGQLSPGKDDIPEGVELLQVPGILEWKAVIANLSQLIKLPSLSGAERLVIEDFLYFVDTNFSFLNPFDRLSVCNGHIHLVVKRLWNVLLSIAKNKESVIFHRGWQAWCIETGLSEIRLIGLTVSDIKGDKYTITINLYYGDTQSQSRQFYNHRIPFRNIGRLKDAGWQIVGNFHVSHVQTHLFWLATPENALEPYYDYWCENLGEIRQYEKQELLDYLPLLQNKGIVEINTGNSKAIEDTVTKTNRQRLNLCPSLGLLFPISSDEAIRFDDNGQLANEFKKRIKEGLGILGLDISHIL